MKLTREEENRAIALHKEALIVLCHDHMWDLKDFLAMRKGGVTAKILHLTVDALLFDTEEIFRRSIKEERGWTKRALIAIDRLYSQIESKSERIAIIRITDDIIRAKEEGKGGVIIGFEGGRPLEGSLEILRIFYRLGARHLQLVWAFSNQLGASNSDLNNLGLTEFGEKVVKEMNRLGMICDISHLSPRAKDEVFEITEDPIIDSHCAAYNLRKDPQNLTDDQLKALARNGGVIGVHFCSHVIKNTPQATIGDLLDQIDYVADIAGIDHVALGPDYFPQTENLRNIDQSPITWVKGLEDITGMVNLTRGLVSRGYSDNDIKKILGGNILRVIRKVFKG